MERLTKLAVSVQGEEKTCCANFMNEECVYWSGTCSQCSTNDKVWDKLRRYEEMEEQGRSAEIVRCEDCKFREDCEQQVLLSALYCEIEKTRFIYYCSHGVRKEPEK
jgi:hypothetical protein